MAFLFVFFFWNSYDSNVGAFHIVPEVPEVVLISFDSFFFFPLCFIYFHDFISTSLILSSVSVILLMVPSRVLLISFIALFIFNWLAKSPFEDKGLPRSLKYWTSLLTYSCDLFYFRGKISDTQKDWKFFEVSYLPLGTLLFDMKHEV